MSADDAPPANTVRTVGGVALVALLLGIPTFGVGFLVAVGCGLWAASQALSAIRADHPDASTYRQGFYSGVLAAALGIFLPAVGGGAYLFWDQLIWWR